MRRFHILGLLIALLAVGCADDEPAVVDTTSTSLLVTTTSTVPPTTSVIAPDGPTGTIEVWAPPPVVTDLDEVASSWEIETGIGVTVTAMEPEDSLTALLQDPTEGPDVFIGPHTWLNRLTEAGIAEPISPGSEDVAGALDAVTLRGNVYATPVGIDTVAQFRNTIEHPLQPDDVQALAAGCGDEEEFAPCLLIPIEAVDQHYPFLVSQGGYVFGRDEFEGWDPTDVGVANDGAIAGVTVLEALADANVTTGDGTSSVEERFADGEAPLLWGTVESLITLRELGAVFVVEELPPIAGFDPIVPVRVTAAWVNSFSADKAAAIEFTTEVLTDPGIGSALAIALDLAPADVTFDEDPDLAAFTRGARLGHPVPTIFQTDHAWEQLAVAFSLIRSGDDVAGALLDAAVAIRDAPPPPGTESDEEG